MARALPLYEIIPGIKSIPIQQKKWYIQFQVYIMKYIPGIQPAASIPIKIKKYI